jgi:hypothetical protein
MKAKSVVAQLEYSGTLPESIVAQVESIVAQPLAPVKSTWRTEITTSGDGKRKYYNFRTGRNGNRKTRYGGKFENLSAERKAQYERNKKR